MSRQPFASTIETVKLPGGRFVAVAAAPPVGFQMYEYGGVPPVSFTVAEPLASPQVEAVAVVRCCKSTGCMMFAVAVAVQFRLSVTVTVNCPAGKFRAVAVVEPVGQLNKNGAVPFKTAAVAEPFEPEKQATFCEAEIETDGPATSAI